MQKPLRSTLPLVRYVQTDADRSEIMGELPSSSSEEVSVQWHIVDSLSAWTFSTVESPYNEQTDDRVCSSKSDCTPIRSNLIDAMRLLKKSPSRKTV